MKSLAKKTYSQLCQRLFDSKAEAKRGEELFLLQNDGQITELEYQVRFILCEIKHFKTQITIDFKYQDNSAIIYEDVKGTRYTRKYGRAVPLVDRDFRTKLAWLKDKHGIDVVLIKDK